MKPDTESRDLLTVHQADAMWSLFAGQPMDVRERLLAYAHACLLHRLEAAEKKKLLQQCKRCNVIRFTPLKVQPMDIISRLEAP